MVVMQGGGRTRVRCCGVCGKPGHNARTCQEAAEGSDSVVSDVMQNSLSLHPETASFLIGYGAPSDSRPRTVSPRAPHK
jgi:hypothetical protein